ncbi:hypothetical protein G9A89_011225 [Geosiphon pyriformis]|nr:hypothetical protein G9A89_011225 [Geosiphon pyriformis]
MSKKKAPIGVFYGPIGGSFSQKKRASVGNVKHSEDKKDIFLVKLDSSHGVYSNMDSVSGDSRDDDIFFGVGNSSFLGLAINTLKAKKVTINLVCGSPLGSINYGIDENNVDPKIVKTQVEVSVRKSFAFNINLSAIEEKSAIEKTQFIEKSIEMAISLARKKEININSNLKRQEMRSNWAVVIKKIPIDTSKNMIIATVSEFGEIKSIKIQLIRIWQKAVVEFAELDQANLLASKWSFLIGKDSVHIAKAVGNHETWVSRDQFRVLLFTLPVGITAHDLGTLLERAGGKTCIINRSVKTGNRICCAMIGFESNDDLESAFHTEPIFGSIKLFWARIDLIQCKKCRKFSYSALECDASVVSPSKSSRIFKRVMSDECCLLLAKLYEKKRVPISRPIAFGGKSWAQVVSLAGFSGGFCFASGSESPFSGTSDLNNGILSVLVDNLFLDAHLVFLEQFLKLLTDQVSVSATLIAAKKDLVLDMVMDNSELVLSLLSSTSSNVSTLGLSSSKVLTTKIGSLESKLVAFEASIAGKFEGVRMFTSGLNSGYLGAGIVVVMDFSLAKHVCKITEMPNRLLSIRLLFKNKLSVSVLGLYAGALSATQFSQAGEINSLILNSLCRQANKDHWKFDFKGADNAKWGRFKEAMAANAAMFSNGFITSAQFLDLDIITLSANKIFRKKWSKSYNGVFIKKSSKFHKLELLVLKIAKASYKENVDKFALFMKHWDSLNNVKALIVQEIVNSSVSFNHGHSVFFSVQKTYCASKLAEFLQAKELRIKSAVVLNHLVVEDELILESDLSLEYIFDDVFSNVMCLVNFDELLGVVSNLPDGKAAGLFEVSNEL